MKKSIIMLNLVLAIMVISITNVVFATSTSVEDIVSNNGILAVADSGDSGDPAQNYNLEFEDDDVEILVGESFQLVLNIIPIPLDDGDVRDEVIWSSTNPAVATVDQDGLVRGISEGTSMISATLDNQTVFARVTVFDDDDPIEIPEELIVAILAVLLLGILAFVYSRISN